MAVYEFAFPSSPGAATRGRHQPGWEMRQSEGKCGDLNFCDSLLISLFSGNLSRRKTRQNFGGSVAWAITLLRLYSIER